VWRPDAWALGPLAAASPEDALLCVRAALRLALEGAPAVRAFVPGPHPALLPLVQAGFRIEFVDTFLSTDDAPFFDPRRYLAAGGALL
jgi:hypothetical protein